MQQRSILQLLINYAAAFNFVVSHELLYDGAFYSVTIHELLGSFLFLRLINNNNNSNVAFYFVALH